MAVYSRAFANGRKKNVKPLDDLKNVDAWIKHLEKISKVNEVIINTGD
jgi:hypothetical protein